MNDNGNIRLLTPENDMRVKAFFSLLENISSRVEKIRDNNKPLLDGERYYTDKELAVKLKVSRRSLQDYRNNGILPYTQVGGKILYRASDIERVLMDGYKETYRLNRWTWIYPRKVAFISWNGLPGIEIMSRSNILYAMMPKRKVGKNNK